MKAIRNFQEFVDQNIVKKQSPDISRAKFLIEESKQSYSNLIEMTKKIEINDSNANSFVKLGYDIIMELIRAKMLLKGYNASGFGAHEAEVSYMRILGFSERDIQFADQVRYFRNGMIYYGKSIDSEYTKKFLVFLDKTYKELMRSVKE